MRKLVYFTIGNKEYIPLFELCVNSLYKYGHYEQDCLIYTSEKVSISNKIIILPKGYFNRVNIIPYECNSQLDIMKSKYLIHSYPNINNYDKILYLDCDILAINNIEKLFDAIGEEKITTSNDDPDCLMTKEMWGGFLFNDNDKEVIIKNKVIGINAGIFGFNVSDKNISTIKSIYDFTDNNKQILDNNEQPAFNYILFKDNNYDLGFNNIILHRNKYHNFEDIGIDTIEDYIKQNIVLLHFCGAVGNSEFKLNAMKNINKLL